MLSSVEQAFVGREEIRAPLKTPAWEATPGVLLRRIEIDLDLTKRSNFFNEPRLRKVKTGDIAIFYKH